MPHGSDLLDQAALDCGRGGERGGGEHQHDAAAVLRGGPRAHLVIHLCPCPQTLLVQGERHREHGDAGELQRHAMTLCAVVKPVFESHEQVQTLAELSQVHAHVPFATRCASHRARFAPRAVRRMVPLADEPADMGRHVLKPHAIDDGAGLFRGRGACRRQPDANLVQHGEHPVEAGLDAE